MGRVIPDLERTFRDCQPHYLREYALYWDAGIKRWYLCHNGHIYFTDRAASFDEAKERALGYLRRIASAWGHDNQITMLESPSGRLPVRV